MSFDRKLTRKMIGMLSKKRMEQLPSTGERGDIGIECYRYEMSIRTHSIEPSGQKKDWICVDIIWRIRSWKFVNSSQCRNYPRKRLHRRKEGMEEILERKFRVNIINGVTSELSNLIHMSSSTIPKQTSKLATLNASPGSEWSIRRAKPL